MNSDTKHTNCKSATALSLVTLILMIMSITTSCTRNNGDIGDWFGKWQMTEIRIDNTTDTDCEARFFWEFQNDIIRISYIGPEGYDREIYYCFGTWSQPSENTLTLDFSHSDDSGDLIYAPFAALHFPSNKQVTLSISNKSGNNITLKYISNDNATEYTYILRKR